MHSRRDRRTTCSSASAAPREGGGWARKERLRAAVVLSRAPRATALHPQAPASLPPFRTLPPAPTLEQHQLHFERARLLVETAHKVLHAAPHLGHAARHALIAAAQQRQRVVVERLGQARGSCCAFKGLAPQQRITPTHPWRPQAPGPRLHHLPRGLVPARLPQVVHKQERLGGLGGQRGAKGLRGASRVEGR